jgi:hypothetical protein
MKAVMVAVSSLALAMTTAVSAALAFSGNWNFTLADKKNNSIDMGTASNRTCFLSGMTGSLTILAAPNEPSQTGVFVTIDGNNEYRLSVQTNAGNRLTAYARCVNSAAGRTAEKTWHTGQAAQILADVDPAHPNRRCFLTAITNVGVGGGAGPTDAAGFSVWTDNVQVRSDGVHWLIGGHQSGAGSVAYGTARCIDVNGDLGSWQWGCGGQCTAQFPLSDDPGGAATCLLTGIGGAFTADDWSDGAFITFDQSLSQFYMNTKNGKTGWANCVK